MLSSTYQAKKIQILRRGLASGVLLAASGSHCFTSSAQANIQNGGELSPNRSQDDQAFRVYPVRRSRGSIWSSVYPGQYIWNESTFASAYDGQISREIKSRVSCPAQTLSGYATRSFPALNQRSTQATPADTYPTQLRFGQLIQVPLECSVGGLLMLKTYSRKPMSYSYVPNTQLLGIVTVPPREIINNDRDETYKFHFGQGSMIIRDTSGSEAASELQLIDIAQDDIKVAFLENDLILTIRGVETIRIIDQRKPGEEHGIHAITFVSREGNQHWTRPEIRMRALADAKPSGFVTGSEHAEVYTHDLTDGSYEINDIGPMDNFDTLVLNGVLPQDVTLDSYVSDLLVNLPGDQTVRIKGQFNPDANHGIEELVFPDAQTKLTWNRAALRSRTMADMKARGFVNGTPFADTFIHDRSDESFSLWDFGHTDDIDTLVLKDTSPEDVRLSAFGIDLTIHLPGRKAIRLAKQRLSDPKYGIEIVEFPDAQPATSWSRDDLSTRLISDMKSSWHVEGTGQSEKYLHYPDDPSYELVDVGPPANADSLVLHGIDPNQVTLHVNRTDLILNLPGEKRIRIRRQLEEGSLYGIEIVEFPNAQPAISWSRDDIIRRSLEDMKTTGSVYGTRRSDLYVHNVNDPSYAIYDYGPSSATDTLVLRDLSPDDVRLSADEDDLILNLPGQEMIRLADQLQPASSSSYGIESLRFEGGPSTVVWNRLDILDHLATK